MIKLLLFINLLTLSSAVYGELAGGRPNSFSGGQNAFAGVVNPANAVWIKDRFDLGVFWFYQESSFDNQDDNPFFPSGKMDLTYKTKNLFANDVAIHKQVKSDIGLKTYSCSLAYYTTPTRVKLHTKKPIPLLGSTSIFLYNKIDTISAIFSLELNAHHSIGLSVDYFYFSHRRNGFQHADNPLRSISPGHVTNKGMDHSNGIGMTVGWRWKITESLDFGAAWVKKSYCGHYRKYRGYEPHHAKNYIPQTFGAGFSYRFTSRVQGRLELLWSNLGNLPGSNNNILSDGRLNLNKRGSKKSPGPGLQDATFIDVGIGYKWTSILSVGIGYSHRIKLHPSSNILSHTYSLQTIYDILAIGANIRSQKHDLFMSFSYGFRNRRTGELPKVLGGGRFIVKRHIATLSFSWGYMY